MNARTSYAATTRNLDPKSEAGLVQQHADLVKRIAYHVAARLPASVDVEDLIQAGVIGLIEAARHYNGERGASFETYAGIRIRGAMMDELRRGDWAPRSVHRRHREISGAMKTIAQREGREAREDEVIAELKLTPEAYRTALQDAVQCQVLSLDAPPDGSDDPFEAADPNHTPLESLERDEFQANLARAIAALPEREKMVLSLYYDDEMNHAGDRPRARPLREPRLPDPRPGAAAHPRPAAGLGRHPAQLQGEEVGREIRREIIREIRRKIGREIRREISR